MALCRMRFHGPDRSMILLGSQTDDLDQVIQGSKAYWEQLVQLAPNIASTNDVKPWEIALSQFPSCHYISQPLTSIESNECGATVRFFFGLQTDILLEEYRRRVTSCQHQTCIFLSTTITGPNAAGL
jgi:hypothetical protein